LHAQSLPIEVLDVHDHPLKDSVLTAGGNGSTSSPSDIAGKTQILLPQGTKPGDSVVLILVRPGKPSMMFSPWEGRATVPTPPGFVTVVVGPRGDLAALQNNEVLAAMLSSIVAKNDKFAQDYVNWGEPAGRAKDTARQQRILGTVYAATLQSVSNEAGFDAHTVDAALRGCVKSDNPETTQLGEAYVRDYPRFPKELNYEQEAPQKRQ
jgi:hypothetical protein